MPWKILLIVIGLAVCLVMGFSKKEAICKLFNLDVKPEDYKFIKIFSMSAAGIMAAVGIILLIFAQ